MHNSISYIAPHAFTIMTVLRFLFICCNYCIFCSSLFFRDLSYNSLTWLQLDTFGGLTTLSVLYVWLLEEGLSRITSIFRNLQWNLLTHIGSDIFSPLTMLSSLFVKQMRHMCSYTLSRSMQHNPPIHFASDAFGWIPAYQMWVKFISHDQSLMYLISGRKNHYYVFDIAY